jgi:hypothetical protein
MPLLTNHVYCKCDNPRVLFGLSLFSLGGAPRDPSHPPPTPHPRTLSPTVPSPFRLRPCHLSLRYPLLLCHHRLAQSRHKLLKSQQQIHIYSPAPLSPRGLDASHLSALATNRARFFSRASPLNHLSHLSICHEASTPRHKPSAPHHFVTNQCPSPSPLQRPSYRPAPHPWPCSTWSSARHPEGSRQILRCERRHPYHSAFRVSAARVS